MMLQNHLIGIQATQPFYAHHLRNVGRRAGNTRRRGPWLLRFEISDARLDTKRQSVQLRLTQARSFREREGGRGGLDEVVMLPADEPGATTAIFRQDGIIAWPHGVTNRGHKCLPISCCYIVMVSLGGP